MSKTSQTTHDKTKWPEGVESIKVDDLDRMGIGKDMKLFWDGKPILIKNELNLNCWQFIGVWLTILGTVSSCVFAALEFFTKYSCK